MYLYIYFFICILSSVNFLDTTVEVKTGTYRPYRKPNDTPLYRHTSSNHPQHILKQPPLSINQRLSRNSSNSTIFDQCRDEYEVAPERSGYNNIIHLSYIDSQRTKRKNNRTCNMIWFNPPFSKNVSSNIAKSFLKLIDKHFPPSHKLHKTVNRNSVKVSYS